MKEFIKKYNFIFYPLFAFFICSILLFGCLFKINRIKYSYDYNSISEVTATVSAISILDNVFFLEIILPDETKTSLKYGNNLDLVIGDKISVHTDGTYYLNSVDDFLIKNTMISFYNNIAFILAFGILFTISATLCGILVCFLCWIQSK